jgi:hypothetical protein
MKFDEMKKLWDTQNNEPVYGINEQALHRLIVTKKNTGMRITHISELLLIVVNMCAGASVFGFNWYKQSNNIFMHALAAWMVISGLYFLVHRIKRIQADQQFDRSMLGDLRYAVSIASYQVRISLVMRWNVLPIGLLVILGIIYDGKSVWWAVAILVFLVLTNYASGWEHNIYKNRKIELERLQRKLENE